ncbi:MAG: ABC transporter ATP-binding protein [Candidatus Heimdallarchaeota archaeon]|nr:MAG: ABC transporter ATP-binding protein [Candidatus Heimdallarchaeota archaeon]
MSNVVQIENLSKNYGQIRALDDVILAIPEGSIFGYLGPNGAGKTTTMKILVGLLHYTGSVKIFDQEVRYNSVEINKRIGFLPDAEMPKNDSIHRFLSMTGKMNEIFNREKRIQEVLAELGLRKLRNRKIGNLSRGQRQRVGLANALLTDPQLLILDEPNSGLDPVARVRVLSLLKDLAKDGKSIIFSSHIIGEVDKIATDIAIIHRGRIIEQGTRKDLFKRYLSHGKYVLAGKVDREKALALDYVKSCDRDSLGRYIITTPGDIPEEQLLVDLIQKAGSKIKYFSSLEFSLENLFLESINGRLMEGEYA